MPPKTPDHEWIRQKLGIVTEHADDLRSVAPETVNEIGPWAALKLFQLMVTTDLYTRIISNVQGIDRKLYFDIMAGSGVVSIEGHDVDILGSAIIAATFPEHPFDEMYFFEGNLDRAEALKDRLDYLAFNTDVPLNRDACQVVHGDSNITVPEIVQDIVNRKAHKGANQLSFVDNERMEINWDTMVSLSQIWGDFLINFQHKGVSREFGYINSDDSPQARVETAHNNLSRFFGGEEYRDCKGIDGLRELYEKKLAHIGEEYGEEDNNRPIQEEVPIRGANDKYSYDLIYATRRTGGGSPYADFMQNMRERIGKINGDDIAVVLDIMAGKATGLNDFVPNEEELNRESGQSGIDDFC